MQGGVGGTVPDFHHEIALGGRVAGIDEVGRGPWAGPVLAAAVIIDAASVSPDLLCRIDDSKKLSAARREAVAAALHEAAQTGAVEIGIGAASVVEIDRDNILRATFTAMRRALHRLAIPPVAVLVDGNKAPDFGIPCRTLVKGDQLSLSIAAASIVAKVARDALMTELGRRYPEYGFHRNAGYGTAQHAEALSHHGVTAHHRRSFAPINALLTSNTLTQKGY
jgi:ribonuclease HII